MCPDRWRLYRVGAERGRIPETRYAKTADGVHIAYQVVGDGPVDMVFVMGWLSNVEAMWEEPDFAEVPRIALAGSLG